MTFEITNTLTIQQVKKLLLSGDQISLSKDSANAITKCRAYLDQKLSSSDAPIYGINTGFGSLYNKYISKSDLGTLQENLMMSHACGMGDMVSDEIVQLMLLFKIQSLSYGHSGVQLKIVERLIDFYNTGIYPIVYEFGSLGASGDLAPLAHLSLPLIGKGEVRYKGKIYPAGEILNKFNFEPIALKAKEGLALLNGTQFMSALGVYSLLKSHQLIKLANVIGALSLDVFDGRIEPFETLTHSIRSHKGIVDMSSEIFKNLAGSELINAEKIHVQDPYSFRCIPQVHGASKAAIDHVTEVFEKEINCVTDNPLIFPDEDRIISAGHFHGQPLALTLDYLSIALAEMGSISERRTFQLISGSRNLPNYLVANPGINSGMMIPQYTAASIVSMNKQLCTPSSIDSIVSSNGQEDHVSMGANAAMKATKVVHNSFRVIAIELITAAQALYFKRPLKTSPFLEDFVHNFRNEVPFIEVDRILHHDLIKAEQFLLKQQLD